MPLDDAQYRAHKKVFIFLLLTYSMADDLISFQEKVKKSFKKARDDAEFFKNELNDQKKDILALKSDMAKVLDFIKEIKDDKAFFNVSTGNEGVSLNAQRRATTLDAAQSKDMDNPTLKKLKDSVEEMFVLLSDRDFSIFVAIYQLEEKLRREINYDDITLRLKIDEGRIRNIVNKLIRRGIPIQKSRYLNGKVSLSIKKELKDAVLMDKLIKLRGDSDKQTNLFDN